MGYISTFTLDIVEPKGLSQEEKEEIYAKLFKVCDYAQYCLTDDGSPNESGKWYDMKEDMVNFSKENPGYVFKMYREGEESGDIEQVYFLDGLIQVCKAIITFPEYRADSFIPYKKRSW